MARRINRVGRRDIVPLALYPLISSHALASSADLTVHTQRPGTQTAPTQWPGTHTTGRGGGGAT